MDTCIYEDKWYLDISVALETRFATLNYELNRPLPEGKNKKVISVMKDELGGKIITVFSGLKAKAYSYLIDNCREGQNAKGIKNIS